MLTQAQTNTIERMQRQVLKLAYGWEYSYEELCAIKGVVRLEERREKYIDRFVTKTLLNPRFSEPWFPLREPGAMDIRSRRNFYETKSRTTRYYNSPLSFMRRRANELGAVVNRQT